MGAVEWKDEYTVGNGLIDEQHQELFAIVNRLHENLDDDQLKAEIMNLYKHTREHFADEEALMREAHYVYYKEHRADHDRLLKTLTSHVETVIADSSRLYLFQEFLMDWTHNHVVKLDRSLSGYLDSN